MKFILKNSFRRITLCLLLLTFLGTDLSLFAEGTAQLRPTPGESGLFGLWTDYPGQFRPGGTYESVNFPDFRYNIRISNDFANELIHIGATPGIAEDMYFRVRDPQDNIIFGPQLLACDAAPGDPGYISSHAECQAGPNTLNAAGYTPFTITPAMAGDYYIEFNPIDPDAPTADRNDKFIAYLDVTVENSGAAVDGRFWSKIWEMNQRETGAYSCGATDLVLDQRDNITYTQYVYDTNDSIVTTVYHDKIDPKGNWFIISNDSGPLNTGDFTVDRQSQPDFDFANLRPQHGLFWNEPDVSEFPIGILGDIDDNSVTATGCPIEGICINVTSNKPGQVAIFVDLNGTPGYQPNTEDVFLEDTISAGFNCVEWDGRDGFGTPLPEGTYDVTVQARYSPVHLPFWDMETNVPGFLLTRVNPAPMNLTIYWDDALIAGGTQELLGVASPDHTWPVVDQGNDILFNTYWFGSVDEFLIPVDLVLTCPPTANLDTETIPSGGTVTIDVLLNDTDPEDNIDPTLVTILAPPTAGGTATVDPVTGEITYTGPPGYTGLDSILYQVTDETGFSDTAWVVITTEAVPGADLSLTKDMSPTTAIVGDAITFTVTVTNDGPDDATGVEVTDQLPTSYTYVSDDSGGTYDAATGLWTIGNIAAGASVVLTIETTLNDFDNANVAEITASDQPDPDSTPGNDDPTEDDQDSAGPPTGIDPLVSDLSLTKDMAPAIAEIGDAITFTVTVTNDGPDDATGVEVTDQLPASYAYVSDDSGGTYDPATGLWTIGSIASGASTVLTIEATLNDYNDANVAEITGSDNDDPDSTPGNDDPTEDDQDTAGPPSAPDPDVSDLSLTKDMAPSEVAVGGTLTFTVTVTNDGPDDATGVEVTDQLPASYTYVSDDSGGTYDPATGLWTIGTIANGASAVLTIEATLNDYNDSNVAEVTGSDNDDPDSTPGNDDPTEDDQDTAGPPTMPTPVSDLSLTKELTPTIANIGDMLTFTITVTNDGPDDADNAEVTDQLPASYSFIADDGAGAYDPVSGLWTIGTIAAGSTAVLNIMATLNDYNEGNVAEITGSDSDDPDSTPDNDDPTEDDQDQTDPPSPPVSDLSLTKDMSPTIASIGDVITFIVTVSNDGPQDANNVEVTDQLPASFSYLSDDSGGAYDPTTGIWTVGTVAAGGSSVLTIQTALNDYNSGNVAEVTGSDSDDPDSTPGNNDPTEDDQDQTDPPSPPVSDLSLTKDMNPTQLNAGEMSVFTLVLTNDGPQDANNVEVTDQLESSFTYLSDDSGGAYDPATGLWQIGTIANGASVTLNIMVTVNDFESGNVASVSNSDSDDPDSTPGNNDPTEDDQDQTDPPTPLPTDISLSKEINPTELNLGDMATFTLTIENAGPGISTGVIVNDQMPADYVYISSAGDGTYDSATGDWVLPTLAPGASAVLEIMVQVVAFENGNVAQVTASDQPDPDSDPDNDDPNEDDYAESDPPRQLTADLELTKTVSPASVHINDPATFTISVTNNGPDDAINVMVTDDLPSGLIYISDSGAGAFDPATGVWDIGMLASGSTVNLDINVIVVDFLNAMNFAEVNDTETFDPDSTPDSGDMGEDDEDSALPLPQNDPPYGPDTLITCVAPMVPTEICLPLMDPDGDNVTITDVLTTFDCNIITLNDSCFLFTAFPGSEGIVEITVFFCDDAYPVLCDSLTVLIDVGCDAPFGVVDYASFSLNGVVVNGTMTSTSYDQAVVDVLANDSDPCDYDLELTGIAENGENGIAQIVDGEIVYTPFLDFTVGMDTVDYILCNECGACDTTQLIIDIDICITEDIYVCAEPLTEITICPEFCLDGDAGIVEVDNIFNCIIDVASADCITYVALPGIPFGSVDSLFIISCNTMGDCDTAQVFINIEEDCPGDVEAFNDSDTTEINTAVTIDVLTNDDGEYLDITYVCDPENGTATVFNGEIIYLPNTDYVGTDSFCYVICNTTNLLCDTAMVTVTIFDPCMAEPATISADANTVCVGAGDVVTVSVDDPGVGDLTYIITDLSATTILAGPTTDTEFTFDTAPPGTCLIWAVTSQGDLDIPTDQVADISGCFELSNPLDVTRVSPEGATITADDDAICIGQGEVVTVSIADAGSGTLMFVVTDSTGTTILAGPTSDNEFTFDTAPEGTCLIWAVTYEGDILVPTDQVADIMGCIALSNPLAVTREVCCIVDPSTISADDDAICLGDGEVVTVTVDNAGTGTLAYIITDETATTILGGPTTDNTFTFDAAPPGTCLIWAVNYTDSLIVGSDQVADISGCFTLSNSIPIVREVCCDALGASLFADTNSLCQFTDETVTVSVDDPGFGDLVYIVTDSAGETILFGPETTPDFVFDNDVEASYIIWAVTSLDSLSIPSNQVSDITGCFALSNPIPVEVAECADLCEIVIPEGFSPNGDGVNDEFEVLGLLDPVCNCTDIKYQVFNRWGNMLYETFDPATDGWWDGTWEGDPVPDGTYYYCIICNESDTVYGGFVEVQR